jgi:kynurenine formamidase
MGIVDLSHPVHPGMATYPGFPGPESSHLAGPAALPARGARFTAAPVAFAGAPSFPVRVFAVT